MVTRNGSDDDGNITASDATDDKVSFGLFRKKIIYFFDEEDKTKERTDICSYRNIYVLAFIESDIGRNKRPC